MKKQKGGKEVIKRKMLAKKVVKLHNKPYYQSKLKSNQL